MRTFKQFYETEFGKDRKSVLPPAAPSMSPSHFSGQHPWAKRFQSWERSWPVQAAAIGAGIVGFVALLLTLIAFYNDLQFREEERASMRLDRIERAWNRVLRPVTGNTGKGAALSYLHSQGVDFRGVDISCKTMGGWLSREGTCAKRVVLSEIVFDESNIQRSPIDRPTTNFDISHALINNMRLSAAAVELATEGAVFSDALIDRSILTLSGKGKTTIKNSTIANTSMSLFVETEFINTDVSGIRFFGPKPLESNTRNFRLPIFNGSYADANNPPRCSSSMFGLLFVDPFQMIGKEKYWGPCPSLPRAKIVFCQKIETEEEHKLLQRLNQRYPNIFPPLVRHKAMIKTRNGLQQLVHPGLEFLGACHDNARYPSIAKRNLPAFVLTYEQAAFLYPHIYLGRPLHHP